MTTTQHRKDADVARALDLIFEARAYLRLHGYADYVALLDTLQECIERATGVTAP